MAEGGHGGARGRRVRGPGRRRRAPLPRLRRPRRLPGGDPARLLLPPEPGKGPGGGGGGGRRGVRHIVRPEERVPGRAAAAPRGGRRGDEEEGGRVAGEGPEPEVVRLRLREVRRVAEQRRRPAALRPAGADGAQERCRGDAKREWSRRRRHLHPRLHVLLLLLGADRIPRTRRREPPQADRRGSPRLRRQPQAGELRVHAAGPRRGHRAEPHRSAPPGLVPPRQPLDGLHRRHRPGRQAPGAGQIGHARRAAVLPAVRGEGEPGGAAQARGEEALAAIAVRLGGDVLVRAHREDHLLRRLQEPPVLGVADQDPHAHKRRGHRGEGPDEAHAPLGVAHDAQRDLRRGEGAGPEPGGAGGGGGAGEGRPWRRRPGGPGRVQQPPPEVEAPARGAAYRRRARPPDGGVRQGGGAGPRAPGVLVGLREGRVCRLMDAE
ncbi:hypothetical protein VPH35_034880 [Triticum aestivum]